MQQSNITTSAPGKLMLFGEHAVVHGYPCMVTAINQRTTVQLSARPAQKSTIEVIAPQLLEAPVHTQIDSDVEIEYVPKQIRFVYSIVRSFCEQFGGDYSFSLYTHNGFSSEYGLGSSSAVTVATALALSEFFEAKLSKEELFSLCFKTVLEVQKTGSGFDIAAAIWGGTSYYVKNLEEFEQIESLPADILTAFSGVGAQTVPLIRQVDHLIKIQPALTKRIFETIGEIVQSAKSHIGQDSGLQWAELMQINHGLLVSLGVSSAAIEQCRHTLLTKGYVSGVKISGAGGGDCVIGMSVPGQLEKARIDSDVHLVNVQMHEQGVRVE